MHSAVVQELADLRRRDTEVSVPTLRRRKIRRKRRASPETETKASQETSVISGNWVDPGDTLAPATRLAVTLREATVRRNHQLERSRSKPPDRLTLVELDWVRARDIGLRARRIGKDAIEIRGVAKGVAPGGRHPALSIGIDGTMFTVPVYETEDARAAVARLADRLVHSYVIEITDESGDNVQIRLRSHT